MAVHTHADVALDLEITETHPARRSTQTYLQELAQAVVSPRTGIVQATRSAWMPLRRRKLFGYFGQIGYTDEVTGGGSIVIGALSWDKRDAMVAALAEGVERHVWDQPSGTARLLTVDRIEKYGMPTDRFARPALSEAGRVDRDGCVDGLGRPGLPPTAFVDRPWLRGRCLSSGLERWALAGTVLPAYEHPARHGHLCDLSSTGLAAGRTQSAALAGATAEVVERDAYAITHLNRLPLPEIDLTTVPDPDFRSVLEVVDDLPGLHIRAWDMTLDIRVPTILCGYLVEVDGTATVRLGAATHPSAGRALRKAFTEATVTGSAVREDEVRAHRRGPWSLDSVTLEQPEHHAALCDRLDYQENLGWLLRPRRRLRRFSEVEELNGPAGDPSESLEWLIRELTRCDLSAYGFELAPPDIREATGLEVWRVVVPGAQPLVFGRGAVGLDSERLRWAPVRAGFRDRPLPEAQYNPLPHCFP